MRRLSRQLRSTYLVWVFSTTNLLFKFSIQKRQSSQPLNRRPSQPLNNNQKLALLQQLYLLFSLRPLLESQRPNKRRRQLRPLSQPPTANKSPQHLKLVTNGSRTKVTLIVLARSIIQLDVKLQIANMSLSGRWIRQRVNCACTLKQTYLLWNTLDLDLAVMALW